MKHDSKLKKGVLILFLFIAAYMTGVGLGMLSESFHAHSSIITSANVSENWGLSFQKEGERPIGNAEISELSTMNTAYCQDTNEKVLYLTFDCGYENGNTESILDALKKHNAPASFFIVGTFLRDNPELVKRMTEEGHIVGNHTWHHPDMSSICTESSFLEELESVETLFQETTGQKMVPYYRPPQGKFSRENLKMAKELGYYTFFWSLAYVDWYENDQPTREEAFEKLLKRIHPGAIVLLHNTSSTNAMIMDELLSKWEEAGYRFAPLSELVEKQLQ